MQRVPFTIRIIYATFAETNPTDPLQSSEIEIGDYQTSWNLIEIIK